MQKLTFLFFPFAFLLWLSGLFTPIDVALALFFNHLIYLGPIFQTLVALLNSKGANWLYDAVMALFLIYYILPSKERGKRLIEVSLLALFTACCFYFWNRFFFGFCLNLKSASPSGSLPHLVHLSSYIDWIKIKEFSNASYPGDHGSTICMFVLSIFYLMGRKMGVLALLSSIPFALPRLIVGAHWTSDLLLGSLPLALFNLGWFLYTPLFKTLVRNIYALGYARKSL